MKGLINRLLICYAVVVLMLFIFWKQIRADDEFILAMANADERILLTQDKDFGELIFRLKNTHHGVILIRLEGYKPHLKAEIVLNTIIKHSDELIKSFTVIHRMPPG